jgi:predicted RNA-binding protein associated with RNAse of E/G family
VTVRVRLRGIYATALAESLRESGIEVVQPSPVIAERFAIDAETRGYDATIEATDDRLGVGVTGAPDAVDALGDALSTTAIDAFARADGTPQEAVFGAVVTDARSGGAVVDLGSRKGYLPSRAVDGDPEPGDRCRVQVRESTPPWSDDHPRLGTGIRIDGGGLLTLSRPSNGRTDDDTEDSGSGSAPGSASPGTGIGDVTDLLPTDVPLNWRARPTEEGEDASFDALEDALADAVTRAEELDEAFAAAADIAEDTKPDPTGLDENGPRRLWAGSETTWVRFGRASRFALDDFRRAATATMPGHHRIKASTEAASAAVDFAESVAGSAAGGRADAGDDLDFPFDVATRHFGPMEDETVAIAHGKPDGREIALGHGEVLTVDPDGTLLLRREMRSEGTYDAIGTDRRAGDVAITRFKEGRWWYQTRYRSADGNARGTYVNVCTPVECFPDAVRYTDLYVDVVRRPDGEVERVDDDELDEAVADGLVEEELAGKARSTATVIERSL